MATHPKSNPPRRSTPFDQHPGFYEPAGLWLHGNAHLLDGDLACVSETFGSPPQDTEACELIERIAERFVREGRILVTGVHGLAHQRAAIVPLRWGAPRIVVLSGGFFYHLGDDLKREPFRAARLWRYEFDPRTDLAVSRRAPDRLPTFALHNRTVDRLVLQIATRQVPGTLFGNPRFIRGIRGWVEAPGR